MKLKQLLEYLNGIAQEHPEMLDNDVSVKTSLGCHSIDNSCFDVYPTKVVIKIDDWSD